jgi:predicted metal-dependent phosphoesterase TrpH
VRSSDPVDLHLHTTYSDGHWRPEALFDHLAQHGFRAVAITDHDTVRHVDDLRVLGAARGIRVLAGVELTTSWHDVPAHLLCYADRFVGSALEDLAAGTEQAQRANTHAVYAELVRRGYTFTRQADVLADQGGEPLRPVDNARLLQAHGCAEDLEQALALIADAGYRQMSAPLDRAVSVAHAAGAVTLLAHPGRGGGEIHQFAIAELDSLLAEVPLDGIEVYYPTHSPEQVASYAALVERQGLLGGAGSDSHGPQQRLPVPYPARLASALLARCGVLLAAD